MSKDKSLYMFWKLLHKPHYKTGSLLQLTSASPSLNGLYSTKPCSPRPAFAQRELEDHSAPLALRRCPGQKHSPSTPHSCSEWWQNKAMAEESPQACLWSPHSAHPRTQDLVFPFPSLQDRLHLFWCITHSPEPFWRGIVHPSISQVRSRLDASSVELPFTALRSSPPGSKQGSNYHYFEESRCRKWKARKSKPMDFSCLLPQTSLVLSYPIVPCQLPALAGEADVVSHYT